MATRSPFSNDVCNHLLTLFFSSLLLITIFSTPALAAEPESTAVSSTHFPTDSPLDIEELNSSASETVEIVVRLEEVTIPETASDADAEQLLTDHANETQVPVLEYAATTPGVSVETEFWLTNAVLLEVDPDRIELEALESVTAVETVHRNFELTIQEPQTTRQTGETSSTAVGTEPHQSTAGIELLNAPAVWDAYETRGDGVRVAVLDTGIDAAHPDIDLYTANSSDPTYPGGWAAFDETGDRVDGSTPYDSGVHGTHVSGTVAGGGASGTQIGVAPDVELLHGLVLNETSGSFAQLIAGMEWALEEDADVINLSLGMTGTYSQLVDPVTHAIESGAVVVAAVGNEGVDSSSSPANVYDVISVGAVHEDGTVASFSGGEHLNRSEWHTAPETWPTSYVVPTAVAHGVGVTSAVPGGGYQALPGTSMATPHVSGTVALLLSVEPDATPNAVSTALSETAWKPDGAITPQRPTTMDTRYGYGIVDAKATTDAVVAVHSDTETSVTDETAETEATETMATRETPPFSRLVAGTAALVVTTISVATLLLARSLARETKR